MDCLKTQTDPPLKDATHMDGSPGLSWFISVLISNVVEFFPLKNPIISKNLTQLTTRNIYFWFSLSASENAPNNDVGVFLWDAHFPFYRVQSYYRLPMFFFRGGRCPYKRNPLKNAYCVGSSFCDNSWVHYCIPKKKKTRRPVIRRPVVWGFIDLNPICPWRVEEKHCTEGCFTKGGIFLSLSLSLFFFFFFL